MAEVAAAEDKLRDELVEHDPIRDARVVTAPGMCLEMWGKEGLELDPQGLDRPCFDGGHRTPFSVCVDVGVAHQNGSRCPRHVTALAHLPARSLSTQCAKDHDIYSGSLVLAER